MRPTVVVLAVLTALGLTSPLRAELSAGESARRSTPVATVGGQPIALGTLEDRLLVMPDFQRASFGATDDALRRGVLEQVLVRNKLFAREADRRGDQGDALLRYELDRARSSATLREIAKSLTPPARIPASEVDAYYEAHKATYQAADRIAVWRILVKTPDDAKRILAALGGTATPAAWAELCRNESLDQATKLRRGDVGYLNPDGSSSVTGLKVDPALYAAVAEVTDGTVLPEPVVEGENLAVVWRRGSVPAHNRSRAEVDEEIRRLLFDQSFQKAKTDLLANLKSTRVSVLNDGLLSSFDVDPGTGILRARR